MDSHGVFQDVFMDLMVVFNGFQWCFEWYFEWWNPSRIGHDDGTLSLCLWYWGNGNGSEWSFIDGRIFWARERWESLGTFVMVVWEVVESLQNWDINGTLASMGMNMVWNGAWTCISHLGSGLFVPCFEWGYPISGLYHVIPVSWIFFGKPCLVTGQVPHALYKHVGEPVIDTYIYMNPYAYERGNMISYKRISMIIFIYTIRL